MPLLICRRRYDMDLYSLLQRERLLENVRLIYGDNTKREGTGGQAIIRSWTFRHSYERMGVGIATKWEPTTHPNAYFTDKDLATTAEIIGNDFKKVKHLLDDGKYVFWPEDGIGTGMSKLMQTSPLAFNLITNLLGYLVEKYPQNLDHNFSTYKQFPDLLRQDDQNISRF